MKRNKEIKSIAIRLICLSLLLNLFSVNTLWGRTKVTSIEKKSPETIDIRYKSVFGDKKIISQKGLLEIVFCENEIYIEIPDSLLNKDFIMGTSVVSTSSTRESWEGVRPKPYKSVSFAKVGKNIHLGINRKRIFNSSLKSDYPNENGYAIFETFPIIEYTKSKDKYLIKATKLFKGDKDYLTPKDENAYNNMRGFVIRSYKYNDKAEVISSVSSDSISFSVLSELSYLVTRKLFTMSVLATDEPLTAKIRTTFILDDNKNSGYTTFCVPQGLGVMKQNLVDYSDEYQGAKVKFIACRWSKKEDKPIIDFVMDNQFPELWKKAIYKGADIWNKGFEKAGIARTAVSIKENGFDKSDNSLTQNRIRYAVTPLNDIRGSIWVRPNTGEIFNADIVINHDIINNIQIEAFLTLSPYLPQARTLVPDDSLFVNMLAQRVAFNIGKCLGFEENFKASSIYPVDSLSSAAFTQNNGIVASIMDNTNFNYVAGEEGIKSGAKLFQDRAGEIDILNIKYLYGDYKVYEDTIYNSCKLFSEAPVLGNSYIFGSKKSLNGFIDPESLNSDLGDNQIKSSTIGLETLQKVVENGAGWLDLQDIDFNYRASLYDFIIDKYFFYITNVTASIGGKIKDEINGYCEIVDFKNQKDALLWSLERIKEADKFENEELMSQSELNVGIADYITEESFRAVLQKVLSMTEYRETMLSVIDKFVWQNYPQSTNINNKELRTIKMQTLYINTLIKEIGLDKDEVKEIWSKPDNYVVYQLLVQNKQKIYNNQNVGSKAFRDNNAYLLKLLNDKL